MIGKRGAARCSPHGDYGLEGFEVGDGLGRVLRTEDEAACHENVGARVDEPFAGFVVHASVDFD